MHRVLGPTYRRIVYGSFCFRGTVALGNVLVDGLIRMPLKATVSTFCSTWTGQDHFFFVLINACLTSDELNPLLSVLIRGSF